MSRHRYTAENEVARRFAANQELAGVINKVLQAHEREMRARMLVEMPRLHPAPPSVLAANQRALDNFANQRQAAVVEFCDTLHDRLLDAVASVATSSQTVKPFLWVGAIP